MLSLTVFFLSRLYGRAQKSWDVELKQVGAGPTCVATTVLRGTTKDNTRKTCPNEKRGAKMKGLETKKDEMNEKL